MSTQAVLSDVQLERENQDRKWGEQNHPDGTDIERATFAQIARDICRAKAQAGTLDWADILYEEVAEAFAEVDRIKLRAELIQVAAVAVAWAEAIDRR